MRILFVGQCTFRLTLADGTTLLTDPWFKNNPFWRAVPPALAPDQLGSINYLLSSHNHLDHIDKPSLDLARKQGAVVIGSKRVARRAKRAGIKQAIALSPGKSSDQGSFSVLATPAFHPLAKDAVGFIIRAEEKKIYFCGDTRPDPGLVDFLKPAGTMDIAFLQIACARYFGKDDGLNLATAAGLAGALQPRVVIPMHYHGRFKEADPWKLCRILEGSGIEVKVIGHGEEIEVIK